MRLDKYLAEAGLGTRSEIRKTVRAGRVTVSGLPVRDPSVHISGEEEVCLDGSPVLYEEFVYYMMNKPAGVITASRDRHESTVLDLLEGPQRKDLYPVGRLDRDTEGLLLITNDGPLGHRLLAPGKHVDKVYYVLAEGILTPEHVRKFQEGLRVDDAFTAMPAQLRILGTGERDGVSVTEAEITIQEGKFHQVKRMFEAAGSRVLYLKRLSMGPLKLDSGLAPGEYRRLMRQEMEALGLLNREEKGTNENQRYFQREGSDPVF